MTDSLFNGGGKTGPRKPSFRGRAMYDVSRGNLRVRGWPKKRKVKPGSITAEHNEWFRQAQWATKYWPEPMVRIIAEAREASPILPRDIMTMVMSGRAFYWTNTDGLTVYPVVARNDVSDSLDVVSQFPGSILARGTDYWQPIMGGEVGQVLTSVGPDVPPVWSSGGGGGGGYQRARVIPTLADFTPQNPGGATYTDTDFGLFVESDSPGSTTRFTASNTAPPIGPFEIIAKAASANWRQASNLYFAPIALRNATSGGILQWGWVNGSFAARYVASYAGGPSTVGTTWTPQNWFAEAWWRVRFDGTDILFDLSPDGEAWWEVTSTTLATNLGAIDEIGFSHYTNLNSQKTIFQSFEVVT